jgi:hypothetical protein
MTTVYVADGTKPGEARKQAMLDVHGPVTPRSKTLNFSFDRHRVPCDTAPRCSDRVEELRLQARACAPDNPGD